MPCVSPLVPVEITEKADLRPVMDRLAVDVEHERGHRKLGERSFGRSARPGQPVVAQPAHALAPHRVRLVELAQRLARCAGVSEAVVVARWSAEMGGAALAEDADDDVTQPPGD